MAAPAAGGFPWLTVAGKRLHEWVIVDLDATIITAASKKGGAAATWKKTFGFHPLAAWCANTGECLAMLLRPGSAGSNTVTDHVTVLRDALVQIPLDSNGGIDVRGATHKKAESACKSLAPEGGRAAPPPGSQNADIKKYVSCMRESGRSKFPDPDKGGFRGVDTSTPEFKAAHKAYEKFSPAGAPPPGS
ncbi:transposase [Streptomyces sp. NPDC097727]|uniref:transposase n=1 Tax=Streptomyces sp. NPDC097727 TaxID=3366092 RepID=UPI0037F23FC6